MMQPVEQAEGLELRCRLCLETLSEPATLQCGDIFCLKCINLHWDQQDEAGVYSCPACKKTFYPRPEPNKNEKLCEYLELKKKKKLLGLQQPKPEPATRSDFLRYFQVITLDPNSANKHLTLSGGNRKATRMTAEQTRSDHPDRFPVWSQVLSRESLSGRSYWEVEWTGGWVGVAYRNIPREGFSNESQFGLNRNSWALFHDGDFYDFYHNNVRTLVSGPVSSRVGVYLDHRAGVLSFYSVSDTMTLLHRVHATFTQPLYAGVRIFFEGGTVELCPLI